MEPVFISYVHENKPTVDRIHQELKLHGIEVWRDVQNLKPGGFWKEEIRKAIRKGAFFIACFSKEYNEHDETYMNEELIIAIEKLRQRHPNQVWFIPVKLDKCEIPDIDIGRGKTLEDLTYVKLYEDWDAGIQSIVNRIQPKSGELAEIEAKSYYQIIQERLKVIKIFQNHVEQSGREVIIHQHLYENLWLLDPSWHKVIETPLMEQNVRTEFANLDAKLTVEEQRSRFDIKYRKTTGKHIIIELKRANRKFDEYQLLAQIDKYRTALVKLIQTAGQHEPVEVVCIVGKPLKQWETPASEEASKRALAIKNVRVVLYDELIENAYRIYQDFLDVSEKVKRAYVHE